MLCADAVDSGLAKYDVKVDIWALGITTIEMLEMKPPLTEQGAVRVWKARPSTHKCTIQLMPFR